MTTQAEQDYYDLFPRVHQDTELDAIIEFRNYIKDECFREQKKFEPNHSLLRQLKWPFSKGSNRGKLLADININYLTIIMATSIYATPDCKEEYDELFLEYLIQEVMNRKPFLMKHLLGKTYKEMRELLITGYCAPYISSKMLHIDSLWPIPGKYEGVLIQYIPDKILVSTLCTNCICHPSHLYFNRAVTNWVIEEIEKRIGDK